MSLYFGQDERGLYPGQQMPQFQMPRNYGGGPQNFLMRQFNQGGFGRYGGQQPYGGGPQGSRNPWMQRQWGGQIPRQGQRQQIPFMGRSQPTGGMTMPGMGGQSWGGVQNWLMQGNRPQWGFQPRGQLQGAQGQAMGHQGAMRQQQRGGLDPRAIAADPQGFGRWQQGRANWLANRQPQQPTAPRTMGKPRGYPGRMY